MFFVSPESTGIEGLPVLLSPGNTNTLQAGGKSYQQFLSGLGESVEIGRHKSWSGLNPLSKWCDGELPLQKTLKKKRKICSSHHLQFNIIETVLAQRLAPNAPHPTFTLLSSSEGTSPVFPYYSDPNHEMVFILPNLVPRDKGDKGDRDSPDSNIGI